MTINGFSSDIIAITIVSLHNLYLKEVAFYNFCKIIMIIIDKLIKNNDS